VIAPPWFRGVWKREWIRYGEAAPFEDRIVRDVQTPSVFGSVRIPLDRPHVRSFDDCDDAQLRALLAQKGFAGIATFEDDVATWHHAIDFQPPDFDQARIVPHGTNTVLEVGLDGSFQELWWNLAPNDGRYLGIEWLRGERVHALLAVVGDHFVYARNRAKDIPPADSLAALATTRAEMRELLDCELSYGHVRGARVPWEIRYSTLPWREGEQAGFDAATGTILVNTFSADERLAIIG
jgi:hypothetical protein